MYRTLAALAVTASLAGCASDEQARFERAQRLLAQAQETTLLYGGENGVSGITASAGYHWRTAEGRAIICDAMRRDPRNFIAQENTCDLTSPMPIIRYAAATVGKVPGLTIPDTGYAHNQR